MLRVLGVEVLQFLNELGSDTTIGISELCGVKLATKKTTKIYSKESYRSNGLVQWRVTLLFHDA